MQEKISHIEIKKILDRLRVALAVTTDTELAEALGVKQNTISTWRTRGSLDFSLIISKCDRIDLNWLFLGQGVAHRNEPPASAVSPSIIYQRDPRDIELIETQKELIAMLRNSRSGTLGSARSADASYSVSGSKPTNQ